MNSRLPYHVFVATNVLMALGLFAASTSPSAPTDEGKRPLLFAHYVPWFEAKPASPRWGLHWTMKAFDPDKQRDGKRCIASHYYPLIGPYDSSDPAVIEYHLLLMKLAGIDGVIADWYGSSKHFDYPMMHRNTILLFQSAAKLGLRIGICYEDQTISKLMEAKKLEAAERVKQAQADIEWLRKNWFAEPAYVRLGGKPLLISFGNRGLTDREWEQVFPRQADRPLYLSERRRRSVAVGAFDWPVPNNYRVALDQYYQRSTDWPVAMPVAFPRFHDIYAEAKHHASFGRIPDDEGRTFVTTLRRALESGAPLVQIVTWNDWGEGTNIEPSVEFGYRDLRAVQRLRRQLVDAAFPFTADDLRLPHRLFSLRRKEADRPGGKADLDKIARLLATGSSSEARAALQQLEAGSR